MNKFLGFFGLMTIKTHEDIINFEIGARVSFWRDKYVEALNSQNTLNAMLKEATKREENKNSFNSECA